MTGSTKPAGTTTVYDQVGIREDLEDIIYDISPMDTYFMSNIGRTRATNVTHEWQTDELRAAVATNQAIEGGDFSAVTTVATVRLKNYTSIARKDFVISGTADAVRTAGRAEETAYQTVKQGKELKRDVETHLLAMTSSVTAGSAAKARIGAGVESFIWETQHIKGSTQTTSTTPAPVGGLPQVTVDGSLTALTLTMFTDALQQAWANGGETDTVLVGPVLQAKITTFTGIATRFSDVRSRSQAQIINSADVFVSPFGSHNIRLSRYMRATTVLCLDMSTWAVAWLRPIFTENVAKTGDATKKLILGEYCLVGKAPTANTKITGAAPA